MVRFAKTMSRIRGLLLFAPILFNAGCLGLDTKGVAFPWSEPKPVRVDAVWSKHVEQIPDSVHNGAPIPALTGLLFFFGNNAKGKPITASGRVIIDLFDDGATPGVEPKHREEMIFPADVLVTQKTVNQLGVGYTIAIPCPNDAKNVHLTVRFEPEGGRQPLFQSGATFALDRGPAPFMPTASNVSTEMIRRVPEPAR